MFMSFFFFEVRSSLILSEPVRIFGLVSPDTLVTGCYSVVLAECDVK